MWIIRKVEEPDHGSILALVAEAFSEEGRDSGEEVRVVLDTWSAGAVVDDLELVAIEAGSVVGYVLGSRGELGGTAAVAVAPLAVTPRRHRQGIGSSLMTEFLARAEHRNWPFAVVLGSPNYYGRFGFEAGGPIGIVYPSVGKENPHFQVRRLRSFDPTMRGPFIYCWESLRGHDSPER